jgi:hypothetical protein
LGYPTKNSLKSWHREYEQRHDLAAGYARHPGFLQAMVRDRVVADDWLVAVDSNRYSVPFALIGKTVQVVREGGAWVIRHRGAGCGRTRCAGRTRAVERASRARTGCASAQRAAALLGAARIGDDGLPSCHSSNLRDTIVPCRTLHPSAAR